MSIFEKTPFGTGFERYEKGKVASKKEIADKYDKERGEDAGHFNYLKGKLRKMQAGGADIHFGQINVDALSDKAIDFYRRFEQGKLNEQELDEFISLYSPGDNEYNFAALLRNWALERKSIEIEKEKERLKKQAGKKLEEFKKKNPHVAAYVDDKIFNSLRRYDYKATIDLNQNNFRDYESNLREYFKNMTRGKKEDPLVIIENDPRFKYYRALKEALDLGSGNPEEFIKQ